MTKNKSLSHRIMSALGQKQTSHQIRRTHSGVTTMAMVCTVAPLISMMNGAAASSNFTLLRIPSQPVAPLDARDFLT